MGDKEQPQTIQSIETQQMGDKEQASDNTIHITIRNNRLNQCPGMADKALTKLGRGSYDYRVDLNSPIIILKWCDNSVVRLVSEFVGLNPVEAISRWSKKDKCEKDIPCPDIVKDYNKCMGGVDLADMPIAIYRISIKTNRWCIRLFWHLIDMCEVNAWLLNRCHFEQLREKGRPMTFVNFIFEISEISC